MIFTSFHYNVLIKGLKENIFVVATTWFYVDLLFKQVDKVISKEITSLKLYICH